MAAEKTTRGEWTGLAVIALPCLVYAMDLTLRDLEVTAPGAELEPSSGQLPWIIDSYGFLVAGFLITMLGAAIVVFACMLSACLPRGGPGAASTPTVQPAQEVP
jgi:hypothetical protein